ncbi:MAG: hypothetical protein AAF593_00190 [Planctomycetota bacterium]
MSQSHLFDHRGELISQGATHQRFGYDFPQGGSLPSWLSVSGTGTPAFTHGGWNTDSLVAASVGSGDEAVLHTAGRIYMDATANRQVRAVKWTVKGLRVTAGTLVGTNLDFGIRDEITRASDAHGPVMACWGSSAPGTYQGFLTFLADNVKPPMNDGQTTADRPRDLSVAVVQDAAGDYYGVFWLWDQVIHVQALSSGFDPSLGLIPKVSVFHGRSIGIRGVELELWT